MEAIPTLHGVRADITQRLLSDIPAIQNELL